MMRISIIIVFVSLFSCSLIFSAEKTVIVEGIGDISGSIANAREAALKDAKRQAVEQVVGVFVDSETMIENETVLEDSIYSRAAGYVTDHVILKEENKKRYYRVKIKATVNTDLVDSDLQNVIKTAGDPRVLVICYINGEIDNNSMCRTIMNAQLADKGFKIVDQQISSQNSLVPGAYNDPEKAQKLGQIYDADIVVTATVKTYKIGETMGLISCGGDLSITAVRASTGEIAASLVKQCGSSADIEPQLGLSLEQTESKVISVLAKKYAASVARKIAESLGNGSRTIKVYAENCLSQNRAQNLKQILLSKKGVAAVYLRNFDIMKKMVEFDIDIDLSTDAAQLSNTLTENDITIKEIKQYMLKLHLK